MKTLEQYTPKAIADEAARLNRTFGAEGGLAEYFDWIGKLREECFERLAGAMDPTKELSGWVGQMTARHGPRVEVHGVAYSWLAALGVARYGEAPGHWPAAFSTDDVIRAKRWLYDGNVPEGASYITVEG